LFNGPLPTFRENFMQIRSEVFAQRQTDRQTNNDEKIISLMEVSHKWLYCQHAEPLPCYKLLKCNWFVAQKDKGSASRTSGCSPNKFSLTFGRAGCITQHKYGHSCVSLLYPSVWTFPLILLELTPTHSGNYNVHEHNFQSCSGS